MNTYFDLCAVLSLGAFGLALFVGSLVANGGAGFLRRFRFGNRGRSSALLFVLRIFPFSFSLFVTLGLALPAFLLFEPRQTREAPEPYLISVAGLSVVALGVVAARFLYSSYTSWRISQNWLKRAEKIETTAPIPVFRVETPSALFAVAGIFKPKVFIGREALTCLSREELDAALAHELAHVRSFDNLKRLILSTTRLPGCLSHLQFLDAAWSEAVELAADEQALKGRISALDLGLAIVKIGRLHQAAMPSIAACHLVSSGQSSAMSLRLERLRFLLDNPTVDQAKTSGGMVRLWLMIVALGYLLALPSALTFTHHAMEWLVR